MEPLRIRVQDKNGTWVQISEENPVPIWVINPRQRTIGVENLHILVPYLEKISELLPISINSITDLAGEVGELLEGSHTDYVERLDRVEELLGQARVFVKYFLIAQGVSVILALSALTMSIIAIVR